MQFHFFNGISVCRLVQEQRNFSNLLEVYYLEVRLLMCMKQKACNTILFSIFFIVLVSLRQNRSNSKPTLPVTTECFFIAFFYVDKPFGPS